jgi:hypothetical protein
MFNNSTGIQANNSTFIDVKGDWNSITTGIDEQPQVLANWISPLDFNEQQETAFGQHTEGTGTWMLQKLEFQEWRDGKCRVLWCPGKRKFLALGQTSGY